MFKVNLVPWLAVATVIGVNTIPAQSAIVVNEISPITLTNISFSQWDWFDENDLLQQDSLWGSIDIDFFPDPLDIYYLNVVADAGIGSGWIVQNLPLFPNSLASLSGQSVNFNIGDIGGSSGTDLTNINALITVNLLPLNAAPVGTMMPMSVSTFERRATCGTLGAFGGAGGDVSEPAGHKARGEVTQKISHNNVPSVQEDQNKCLAGAFARSIGWLDQEHKLNSGKTAQEIYKELRDQGLGVIPYTKGVEAKANFLKSINTKATTKILDTQNKIPKIPGVSEERGDLIEWLYKELPTEDVELHYLIPGRENGHIITVTGIYMQGGKTFITYRDDEYQNDPTKGDQREKEGELRKNAQGVYWFNDENNRAFQVFIAISESVVPPKRRKREKNKKGHGDLQKLTLGTVTFDGAEQLSFSDIVIDTVLLDNGIPSIGDPLESADFLIDETSLTAVIPAQQGWFFEDTNYRIVVDGISVLTAELVDVFLYVGGGEHPEFDSEFQGTLNNIVINNIIGSPYLDALQADLQSGDARLLSVFSNILSETNNLTSSGSSEIIVWEDGTEVPEPTSTLSLLVLGTLGAASALKRKQK